MDVHDRIGEGIQEDRRDNAHETGQHYQVDTMLIEYADQGSVVFIAAGE